jgi:Ran GTPase-activating protein (RanGAP) involved in mRNA processing and transport
VLKFLLESLIDNTCLAELRVAGNQLDDEFAVDLAILLEQNSILHTVDISNNPIGPDGAQYLLQSLLQYNDSIESLGDLQLNDYMGVRNREELK